MPELPFRAQLQGVIDQGLVQTLYQPIMDLRGACIHGYEALSRGPSDSVLHTPQMLFGTAEQCGLTTELDLTCVRAAIRGFVQQGLPGRLFLNLSPSSLLADDAECSRLLGCVRSSGIDPTLMVIELTEMSPQFDYLSLRERVQHLRKTGVRVALDDLGEGFSSLRLWSELKPDYVKLDKHFVSGIHQDPHKQEFVRSIQQLAQAAHAVLVAEGVEQASEQSVVRSLGIAYAQGYLIGRPAAQPSRLLPEEALLLYDTEAGRGPHPTSPMVHRVWAERLLMPAPSVRPEAPIESVIDIFMSTPGLDAVAVIDEDQRPVGIVHRTVLLDRFIRPYSRELFGRRPTRNYMDTTPLVVDKSTLIHDLSELVVRKGKEAFTSGFIITAHGRYAGIGSGFDLMRELTQLQIVAARYANPLTGLPGNVPIQQQVERLLAAGIEFVIAYADLNHFKPYNDIYGFRRGDDMIVMLGQLLVEHCDPVADFVGHIGGDDFVVLFQSRDWETRCQAIGARFDVFKKTLFTPEHWAEGGYICENRRGESEFHPLVSLAIGAAHIDPTSYRSYHEVSQSASAAKQMAKRRGVGLFVERRRKPQGTTINVQSSSPEPLAKGPDRPEPGGFLATQHRTQVFHPASVNTDAAAQCWTPAGANPSKGGDAKSPA